ncbi:hypothetical protein [Niallia sp. Krafla_26]|uniref:phage tail protein n=1 Tax=Niallia sp. Krafla_26 TaxID=3064703 RepID=UPI003D17FF85
MAGNNTKMNISYTIKAIDRFTAVHKRLTKQLTSIERIAERVEGVKTIEINADTATATAKLEKVQKKVDSIPRRITTHVKLEYSNWRKGMDRLADAGRDFGEITQNLGRGALFTALPAMVPTVGVLAGGVGALGSAFTSAGLGAVGFASVAIPSISKVFEANEELAKAQEKVDKASDPKKKAEALAELEAVQKQYNTTQMKSVEALRKFNSFFSDFRKKFEPGVLNIFNKSLGSIQSVLVLLEPAIQGTVKAVTNLFDSFDRNLEADDMKVFFDWVGQTAGPNLERLGKGVGNFLAGFANMMVAFDPLAQGFIDGFLRMSEQFRIWSQGLSENQSFQNFIAFVRENTPTVLSLIGNIVTTLVNLGVAMAPIGTKVLEMADKFFAWTSELIKNNEWIGTVIGSLSVIGGIVTMLAPLIITLTSVFKFLWPVIKTVFGWVTKLSGLFKGKFVSTILKAGTTLLRFSNPIGIIISAVLLLADIIISNWSEISSWTKEKWGEIQDFLEGIDLSSIGSAIMQGLINGIKRVPIVGALVSSVQTAIAAAKKVLDINSPSKVFEEIGAFTGEGFIVGMDKMASKVSKASAKMTAVSIPQQYKGVTNSYPNKSNETAQLLTALKGFQVQSSGGNHDTIKLEIPLIVNGREFARATVADISQELGKQKKQVQRVQGVKA